MWRRTLWSPPPVLFVVGTRHLMMEGMDGVVVVFEVNTGMILISDLVLD